jgi:hypothetical protein
MFPLPRFPWPHEKNIAMGETNNTSNPPRSEANSLEQENTSFTLNLVRTCYTLLTEINGEQTRKNSYD